MSKKKSKNLANKNDYGPVYSLTSEENTLRQMPKYYPASRCGAHGDTKYNRRKSKEQLKRDIDESL